MRSLAVLSTVLLSVACYATSHSVAEVRYPEALPAETSTGMQRATEEPARGTARQWCRLSRIIRLPPVPTSNGWRIFRG